jgi:hypothetical protein
VPRNRAQHGVIKQKRPAEFLPGWEMPTVHTDSLNIASPIAQLKTRSIASLANYRLSATLVVWEKIEF